MPIMNDAELDAVLKKDFEDIINNFTRDVLKDIIESINKEVYGAGFPSVYKRNMLNGGLSGTFQKENAQINGQIINSKVDQDPTLMIEHEKGNKSDFIHGSEYYSTNDVRNMLTDWIVQGQSGPLFGMAGFWRSDRDFWQPILDKITNGDFDSYIEKYMSQKSMIWKKI